MDLWLSNYQMSQFVLYIAGHFSVSERFLIITLELLHVLMSLCLQGERMMANVVAVNAFHLLDQGRQVLVCQNTCGEFKYKIKTAIYVDCGKNWNNIVMFKRKCRMKDTQTTYKVI